MVDSVRESCESTAKEEEQATGNELTSEGVGKRWKLQLEKKQQGPDN